MSNIKTIMDSCHCGAVSYTASIDLSVISQCNCSICSKKGALHQRIDQKAFKEILIKSHNFWQAKLPSLRH